VGSNWGSERRLDYIDFRLLTAGFVRRADITRVFSVSVPQASMDLNAFVRLYPEALVYDRSAKRYVPREGYETVRGMTPQVIRLLKQLASEGHPMGWQ
jgi:hypothetical protein